MVCPFLAGMYMFWCRAFKDPYIPTDFEFGEYCRQERYKICPLFCKSEADGKISLFWYDVIAVKWPEKPGPAIKNREQSA